MNRSLIRLLSTYLIIIAVIYICERISFWFYPLAVFILGSQYLTLTLLGHEGVHGLIHKNRFINRTVARYLCYSPFLISHTHYSMNHLRHHRNLGTADDPDVNIYQDAYPSFGNWVKVSIVNTLNLSLIKQFLGYFNGSIYFLRGDYPFKIKTDYFELLVFWLIVVAIVFAFKLQVAFALYWFVPLLVILPWVRLLNSYQHYSEEGIISGRAYNILFRNSFLKELLFPINIGYHEIHHQRPDIPYYRLPEYYLKTNNSIPFKEFSKKIFSSRTNKTL